MTNRPRTEPVLFRGELFCLNRSRDPLDKSSGKYAMAFGFNANVALLNRQAHNNMAFLIIPELI